MGVSITRSSAATAILPATVQITITERENRRALEGTAREPVYR